MFLWLFIVSCNALYFKPPTAETPGWHPISFLKDYKEKPMRIQFIDSNYVLWKGDNEYHLRPDVCPHQGALLSEGTINHNCIQCPYHGLNIGPYDTAHKDGNEEYGKCLIKHNIIWWSPNEITDTIPYCKELDNMCELEINVKGSFSDCYKNSMDFHHAAFVHKNTFGNYAGEPDTITETWNSNGYMEGHFKYGSNDFYGKYTGGETQNEHVYCKPSTTYNIVRGKDNQTMIIFLAMRALSETETKWFLCASSTFVPNNLIGKLVLDQMVKCVAIYEDGYQLSKMANQKEKDIHSYKIKLPLDTIYDEWFKSIVADE